MKSKQFLTTFTLTVALLAISYMSIVASQIGKDTAKSWVKDVVAYKKYLAEQATEPKLILISGSNSLFGIETPYISKFTDMPVVNLASHVEFDLEFFQTLLSQYLRAGDVVVMPLEYEYYRSEARSIIHVEHMLTWAAKDFFPYLDDLDYFQFLASVPAPLVLKALLTPNKVVDEIDVESIKVKIDTMDDRYGTARRFEGYTYQSLNKYGEMHVLAPPSSEMTSLGLIRGDSYKMEPGPITPYFFKHYKKIEHVVKDAGARLILTWPATIRNPKFDLSSFEHQRDVDYFVSQLAEEDITIYCEPALFNIHHDFFYNTKYHLNSIGARLRSIALGDCLRALLGPEELPDLTHDRAHQALLSLENTFRAN